MADRPTITTLASGALYDTDTLNTNFQALRDHFDTVLGINGTTGANNTMTGDVDFANRIARNITLDDPTNTVSTLPDGSAGAPAFSFTSDTDTGMFRNTTNQLGFSAGGNLSAIFLGGDGSAYLNLSPSTDLVVFQLAGTGTNIASFFDTKGSGAHTFRTNSGASAQFEVAHTASAVNRIRVTGAATGLNPSLAAIGTDTDIGLNFTTKGVDGYRFFTNNSAQEQFQILHVASAVNYLYAQGAATTAAPKLGTAGADTDIGIELVPKGNKGIVVGSAAGGDQGTDTINASAFYDDGVQVTGGTTAQLETIAVSSQATIDFETGINSTYEVYKIVITGLTIDTDQRQVWVRVGTGGTPTYQSGATDYSRVSGLNRSSGATSFTNIENVAQIALTHGATTDALGNAAGESWSSVITIYNPASASLHTAIDWTGAYSRAGSSGVVSVWGAGNYKSTTAVTAIRLLLDNTGNFNGGRATLYGIRHA